MATPKREIIAEVIEAGGATMEMLMKAADCKYESVMSNFSMLRLMGKCPVKDVKTPVKGGEDGEVELTYRLVSNADWEEIKADRSAKAGTKTSTKTPAERLELLQKRAKKAEKTSEIAIKRANSNEDSQVLEWRAEIAGLQLKVVNSELADAQMAVDAEIDSTD